MSFPKVTILFSDGNLLKDIAAIDGIAGIVGTVQTVGLIGIHNVVYSLKDAEDKGYTALAEPDFHRHLREFYAELAGNQELHIMGVEDTMSMTQMLDKDNEDGAKKLLAAAKGRVRLLGVFRKPDAGYDAGEDFYDADVETALTKTITFVQDQHTKYSYLRCFVEGRVANEESVNILEPKTIESDYAGLVVGGSNDDGSASIGTALGRMVKYGAHIKPGKVANGPLQLSEVYIGTKKISEMLNLETLHGTGIISFMNHPTKAGFYIGVDRMANTGDFRISVHGRIIDKAAVIVLGTYVDELESEVDIVDGKISELDIAALEGKLEAQVRAGMGDQISDVKIYISPAQDIVNTGKLVVRVRIVPKGYTTFIEVDLGLAAA
ncbi:hypothetical protein ESA94_20425 [Lacibacter luteus]|uniref:DUF2586 family protein n=1 Tax=Lacibacter luteus TaxID=2508719 RepID=A0A4Q1CDX7_9BACT|nr:DUF2586 family protein [Lacibacter luteus]RXK57567.1 hypothetical protein ESA94_20425 [Lacibacter luteus]